MRNTGSTTSALAASILLLLSLPNWGEQAAALALGSGADTNQAANTAEYPASNPTGYAEDSGSKPGALDSARHRAVQGANHRAAEGKKLAQNSLPSPTDIPASAGDQKQPAPAQIIPPAVDASNAATAAEKAKFPEGYGWDSGDTTELEYESKAEDKVIIKKPQLSALITVNKNIDSYALDSHDSRLVELKEILDTALEHNLDLGIAKLTEKSKMWLMASDIGKFLPNTNTGYSYQYLLGNPNITFGGPAPLHLDQPFIIASAGFTYWGYRGGSILFGALQDRNNWRAAQHAKRASMSDTLLQAASLYYDLVLQEAILQIRIRAVETSEAQLSQNKDLQEGGLATYLDVLQAKTQLFSDRQNLINQQIARRDAAIKLADFLNVDQGLDMVPDSRQISKVKLVDENTPITALLTTGLDTRPEIKQYNELRLAAKKQIIINTAKLQPTLQTAGSIYGIGTGVGGNKEIISLNAAGPPTVTHRSTDLGALWSLGFTLKWDLEGLGSVDALKVQQARVDARSAMLQQTKEVNMVISQVRQSYLKSMSTDKQIDEASAQVQSSREELRLAQLRFQNGLGKNIDVLRAQQDFTQALIVKAQAIVNYNIAQAQLIHDMGVTTVAALCGDQGQVKPLSK